MEEEPNRDNTTLKIGFVGRLVSLKNVNTLIESLKNLEHLKWQCEIVGDGEMRAEWENMIKTYHLEDRIMFLGSRENQWILEDFYPNIDIFVNPSLQEGLPTTVIEAKMSGCEVLATDVGGTKEIPDIHLCEPHVESLTLHLENLIKNPLKKPISQAFFTQFSLSEMKKRFEYIFTRVI